MRRLLVVASMLFVSCATSMVPRANTDASIVDYVNRAAALVSDSGAAACPTFRQPDWFADGWYIFVFDERGRTVCHPARPEMVGTMASDLVDANGVHFGNAIVRAAERDAGGWVEYAYARPGAGTAPVPKRSYVRSVMFDGRRYIVGSGGYDLP